ncbi:MAG: PPA1309 family protein [Flaviflexus sp.]|uniref:PPA1309 family protein n=1 Tax=Flaviflexus sp. TaxID=1969482 RepID=UPI00352DE181
MELDPKLVALKDAVTDIEKFVAADGWDAPIRIFAIIKAIPALEKTPELAEELPTDVAINAITDPNTLFSVEQEGLPQASTLEELLAQLAWPEEVDGAAIVAERIIVPPSAEKDLPKDQQRALVSLTEHPEREDVRMAVGYMREGQTWCAIRTRSHDNDDEVIGSPDAVPGLVAALKATFE